MDLHGASALVTGGASGLGWETARRLARLGAKVTIVDLPESGGAERARDIGAAFVAGDVTDEHDMRDAVAQAGQDAPLRVCVNCAGIAPAAKVLDREGHPNALRDFARVVEVNLVGSFNVASHAAAEIARADPLEHGTRGVIITTASVAAFEGQIGQAAYSASKGGVHAMTLPLARELARYGIRVVTIAPGIMETPILAGLPEQARASLNTQVPFPPRLGRPDEFAALVVSIVENEYLNGETIRLDGALRMSAR